MKIEDNFVSYEIAKQLKELGFDERGFMYYSLEQEGKPYIGEFNHIPESYFPVINAPLHQQVLQWLREKHNIHVYVSPNFTFENKSELIGYGWDIDCGNYTNSQGGFNTYQEALNQAITESLKLIK